jgi:4-coumarate--CoA ligase
VDELGRFFIVDRIKELIKVKGNQVAPAELEALLLEHPAIVDVAVIGIPTPDGDEKPMAFVVKHPSLAVSVQEVEDFVKDKTVRYKWLAGGVEWTTEIPKSPSGKILRRQLREQMKEKLKQERNTAKL